MRDVANTLIANLAWLGQKGITLENYFGVTHPVCSEARSKHGKKLNWAYSLNLITVRHTEVTRSAWSKLPKTLQENNS